VHAATTGVGTSLRSPYLQSNPLYSSAGQTDLVSMVVQGFDYTDLISVSCRSSVEA